MWYLFFFHVDLFSPQILLQFLNKMFLLIVSAYRVEFIWL